MNNKKIDLQRRQFLQFMGRSAGLGLAAQVFAVESFAKLNSNSNEKSKRTSAIVNKNESIIEEIKSLQATDVDDVLLAPGLTYQVVVSWKDDLNENLKFGFNNDYTAFIPLDEKKPSEGILWVNHESTPPRAVSGFDYKKGGKKTKEQALTEQENIGGSLVHIQEKNGRWQIVKNSKYNRRITGQTEIPFVSDLPIQGSMNAIGTLANCAGGVTPWKTILTCEENFQDYYGEVHFTKNEKGEWIRSHEWTKNDSSWSEHFDYPPEHYGWVVEVNPKTGDAKKLTSLGRFSHEGATCVRAKDGRVVVYMGDDAENQYIYKFISDHKDSLEKGTLYVAHIESGKWLPLTLENPKLKGQFKNMTELLIRTRDAAKMLGATEMDRPEDCEIDPQTNSILIALTMNKGKNRPHGSILKIEEKNKDFLSLDFKAETFLNGGKENGFICPDNLAFDSKGNLWFTNDISNKDLNMGSYAEFGNNSLFYVPMSGPQAGKVFRQMSSPKGAEFTGPSFSADGKTLFLSVQGPIGNWPKNGGPAPSVIAVKGDLIG